MDVHRLMRTWWSIGQKTMISPGPLGVGLTRPRRKSTPRWYSQMMRTQLIKYNAMIPMKIPVAPIVSENLIYLLCDLLSPLLANRRDGATLRAGWSHK
jgi:hypothetical protein